MNAKLLALIESDLKEIDVDEAYDNMLDECYPDCTVAGMSFCTSRALKELDETTYHCGKNDWLDSAGYIEVNGAYYDGDELDNLKDQLVSDLESEIEDLEEEASEEMENDEPDAEQIASFNAQIEALNKEAEELSSYSF